MAGTLLQFWGGVEVLGPFLPSHWFELGSLEAVVVSYSSFSILGDIWLPFSVQCDLRLGHAVTGRAWREKSTEDVRCWGDTSWSPRDPAWLGRFLPGSCASPRG